MVIELNVKLCICIQGQSNTSIQSKMSQNSINRCKITIADRKCKIEYVFVLHSLLIDMPSNWSMRKAAAAIAANCICKALS